MTTLPDELVDLVGSIYPSDKFGIDNKTESLDFYVIENKAVVCFRGIFDEQENYVVFGRIQAAAPVDQMCADYRTYPDARSYLLNEFRDSIPKLKNAFRVTHDLSPDVVFCGKSDGGNGNVIMNDFLIASEDNIVLKRDSVLAAIFGAITQIFTDLIPTLELSDVDGSEKVESEGVGNEKGCANGNKNQNMHTARSIFRSVVHIDHMNQPAKYFKNLDSIAGNSNCLLRIRQKGKFPSNDCEILDQRLTDVYCLVESGDNTNVRRFLQLLRETPMDVDKRGKSCKERMAVVLMPPSETPGQDSDDFKPTWSKFNSIEYQFVENIQRWLEMHVAENVQASSNSAEIPNANLQDNDNVDEEYKKDQPDGYNDDAEETHEYQAYTYQAHDNKKANFGGQKRSFYAFLKRTDETKLHLHLQAKPGKSITQFSSSTAALGSCQEIGIEIAAQPRDGEANKEVVNFLAKFFNLPKKNIKLISGHKSRQKVVEIVLGKLTFEDISEKILADVES